MLLFVSDLICSFSIYDTNIVFLVSSGRLYGINVCGEGGEYETLTLDCPLFIVSLYLGFYFSWLITVFLHCHRHFFLLHISREFLLI